jgi:intracellular septation protein
MRQFVEFIPIGLFVAVYFYTKDIYIATALLMAGVCVQVGFEYSQDKAISKRTQIVFWVVIIAGAATLVFKDARFIMWKPTIVNWLFSVALISSQFLSQDNLLKKMLGEHLSLPHHVWRNLNVGWSIGFFIAGALNLFVAYSFSTDIWVTYKLVGGFGITLFYMIITMTYLVKGGYIREPKEESPKPVE